MHPGDWQDGRAEQLLTRALAAAQTYYADNGDTYTGFNYVRGQEIDPDLTWQGDVEDHAQAVSIREVGATQLELTTLSASGRYVCIVAEAGSTGAQGMSDLPITTIADCTG